MDKQILNNNLEYWKEVFKKQDLILRPYIDFLLEAGESQIVGVAEAGNHGRNYIYEEREDDLFPYDDIDIDQDANSYEAYVIYRLSQGCEIKYIGLATHFLLWSFINENLEELQGNKGVIKYLEYCKQIGVNERFISYYADYEMEDLFKVFFLDGGMNNG